MSISFECQSCGKKVEAPDKDGGKYGTCPHCNASNYFPSLRSEEEPELRLMPLDDNDETQYGQMMKETHALNYDILQQTGPADQHPAPTGEMDEREIIRVVITYVLNMVAGNLDRAENLAESLKKNKDVAKDVLDRMLRTQRPEPELQEVPPKVLQRMITNLKAGLKS